MTFLPEDKNGDELFINIKTHANTVSWICIVFSSMKRLVCKDIQGPYIAPKSLFFNFFSLLLFSGHLREVVMSSYLHLKPNHIGRHVW